MTKTALITGATGGLGEVFAELFAACKKRPASGMGYQTYTSGVASALYRNGNGVASILHQISRILGTTKIQIYILYVIFNVFIVRPPR